MNRLLPLFALLAAALLALTTARVAMAEEPVVTDIRVTQPRDVTVGDHLRYTVLLQAEPGSVIDLPPAALPPELELIAAPQVSERNPGPFASEYTVTFVVAPFATGELAIPPIPISYASPSGLSGEVMTPPTTITVRATLPPGADQPRDLKPQAVYGTPPADLTPFLVATAVVALVGVAGLAFVRRRSRKAASFALPAPEPVEDSAEDRARRRLDGLAPALRDGDLPLYYAGISETVRGYLTERFGFPAFALTTTELHDRMLREGIGRWQARLVSGLLNECDSVLYAHYEPAAERSDANLSTAYEIVEISRPAAMAEEAEAEAVR